jgi:hypothetical protein
MKPTFFRPLILSLTLVGLAFSGSSARPSAPEQAALTAHEWGTFTSIASKDGLAVKWFPQGYVVPDLPAFVEHFRTAETKSSLSGTVRMETPVLYFYSPTETTVSVKVKFARGVITEWYPHANRLEPNPKAILREAALYDDHSDGSISWDRITVKPGMTPNFPHDDQPTHYYAARETAAAPLQVKAPGGSQQEKFLFYRGVSVFPVPISATVTAQGKLLVSNLGQDEIPQVIWFERRGDKLGYRIGGAVQGESTLDPPELTSTEESLNRDLVDVLAAQGLFPDEARAMVKTWQGSWSEEGSRIFYIVPKSFLSKILPLTINPAPVQTVRVFVGRMEVITPATERAVETALANKDRAVIATYGRFLQPILDQVKAENPDKARQLDDEMSALYSLPAGSAK